MTLYCYIDSQWIKLLKDVFRSPLFHILNFSLSCPLFSISTALTLVQTIISYLSCHIIFLSNWTCFLRAVFLGLLVNICKTNMGGEVMYYACIKCIYPCNKYFLHLYIMTNNFNHNYFNILWPWLSDTKITLPSKTY